MSYSEGNEVEIIVDLDALNSFEFESIRKLVDTLGRFQLPPALVKPCDVCENQWDNGTQPIICAACNVAVHEGCYGVVDRDSLGRWFCYRCISENENISCEVSMDEI